MTKNILIVFVFLFLSSNSLKSQEITGIVSVFNNNLPIAGASVMIKGTTKGTSTDINGNYKIAVDSLHHTLCFSFIGFYSQEIETNGSTTINIVLEKEPMLFDRIILTEFKRKTVKEGDITRIIKMENKGRADTIRFNLTPKYQDIRLIKDSIGVSNIVAHKIAMDSLRKNYIVDDFYNECANESLFDFLFKKIQYPALAKEQGIQGTVYARFTIDAGGNIKDIKILRNAHYCLDNEVLDALNSIPKWIPRGMRDANMIQGKAIELTYTLPLLFEIEMKK